MTLPDYLRQQSVSDLFDMNSMNNAWPLWYRNIQSKLNGNLSASNIINLGEHLTEIFTSTGGSGRSQGSLSGGGAASEGLVCWYLNLCTIGTRIVAVKKMSLVPEPLQKALTVNYGNTSCNTESDITIIVFPDKPNYTNDISAINVNDENLRQVPLTAKNKFNLKEISSNLARVDFDDYEIGVVQCKTNWNDNAQIPMLWDMIYSANGFKNHKISIGRSPYSINDLRNFSYSFVTVPSNKTPFKPSSVAVKRVSNLSGGNYWGKSSEPNVAESLKQIFLRNFQSGYNKNLRSDLDLSLKQLTSLYQYFRL